MPGRGKSRARLESGRDADLFAAAECDRDHRGVGADRVARRRLGGVPLAPRGDREAGGDSRQNRRGVSDQPRDRPGRARLGPGRRFALHGRCGADRRPCPRSDRDPGPLHGLCRFEWSARDGVPRRSRGGLARSTHARRGGRVGSHTRSQARRSRPRRTPGCADERDDCRDRRVGAGAETPARVLRRVDRPALLRGTLVAGDDRARGRHRRPRRSRPALLPDDVGHRDLARARARCDRPVRIRCRYRGRPGRRASPAL